MINSTSQKPGTNGFFSISLSACLQPNGSAEKWPNTDDTILNNYKRDETRRGKTRRKTKMTPTLVQMQRKTTKKRPQNTIFITDADECSSGQGNTIIRGREEGNGSGTGASGQLEPKHLTGQTVHTLQLPTLVTFRWAKWWKCKWHSDARTPWKESKAPTAVYPVINVKYLIYLNS